MSFVWKYEHIGAPRKIKSNITLFSAASTSLTFKPQSGYMGGNIVTYIVTKAYIDIKQEKLHFLGLHTFHTCKSAEDRHQQEGQGRSEDAGHRGAVMPQEIDKGQCGVAHYMGAGDTGCLRTIPDRDSIYKRK